MFAQPQIYEGKTGNGTQSCGFIEGHKCEVLRNNVSTSSRFHKIFFFKLQFFFTLLTNTLVQGCIVYTFHKPRLSSLFSHQILYNNMQRATRIMSKRISISILSYRSNLKINWQHTKLRRPRQQHLTYKL